MTRPDDRDDQPGTPASDASAGAAGLPRATDPEPTPPTAAFEPPAAPEHAPVTSEPGGTGEPAVPSASEPAVPSAAEPAAPSVGPVAPASPEPAAAAAVSLDKPTPAEPATTPPAAAAPVAPEAAPAEPGSGPVAPEDTTVAPAESAPAEPAPAEPAAATEPAPSRSQRLGGLLPVLALALLTVLLLVTGYLAWQVREEVRTDAARTDGLQAARDAGRLLFSYDHSRLEQDFEAALALTTGDFREEYERTTREVVQPVAEQYDAVVKAETVEAAVVSAEPDRVVAIVFVNQTTTSTRVEGPKIDQSRVRIVLRDVDGQWLVEEVKAL